MNVTDAKNDVVVVAIASQYSAGQDAGALWDEVLHQRPTFRDIPTTRLVLSDYNDNTSSPDSISVSSAGLIEGWAFDNQRFRVPRDQVVVTDTAHWLALDTGVRLFDKLTETGLNLDRPRTGVVLGNSLTGETSRALALRHRWPYIRRALLKAGQVTGKACDVDFLAAFEAAFKDNLAASTTDSLAGGLSNTIAGRIMNYLDLRGPSFTVDGACASSLLSVIQVKEMLDAHVIDVGVAGGVDMSIDPFELVGFSRLGAMATGPMRVYDENPTGFIPGEGCGMVAMMRRSDADNAGLPVLAVIAGTGMASDGQGGLTRPTEHGHQTAALNAYRQANLSPDAVGLFEGHGTGTPIGDEIEISVLSELRSSSAPPAALGSVKANIGHTKAAAGVAGLIKAIMAVSEGVLPPATGVSKPRTALRDSKTLRVLREPEPWDTNVRVAGVSALGFGGINAHVVVRQGHKTSPRTIPVTAKAAGHAVFALTAATIDEALTKLEAIRTAARSYSDHECSLAAAHTARNVNLHLPVRVSFPVHDRDTLRRGLDDAISTLGTFHDANSSRLHVNAAAVGTGTHKVALLFPGQGAPIPRRQPAIRSTSHGPDLPALDAAFQATATDPRTSTDVAQPAIVASSLTALTWLTRLGCRPHSAIGHSLGEIPVLAWAGSLTVDNALHLAAARGRLMSSYGTVNTGMLSVAAAPDVVTELIDGLAADNPPVIAAYNGPTQVTVAGPTDLLAELQELARRRGTQATLLAVSHGFHSPAMDPVLEPFEAALQDTPLNPTNQAYISTITGKSVPAQTSPTRIRALLTEQLTSPVEFEQAVTTIAPDVSLFVEAGPGTSLTALTRGITDVPVVAMDLAASAEGTARTVAALIAAGQCTDLTPWTDLTAQTGCTFDHVPQCLTNPCGDPDPDATTTEHSMAMTASRDRSTAGQPTPPHAAPHPTPSGSTGHEPAAPRDDLPAQPDGVPDSGPERALQMIRSEIGTATGLDLPEQAAALRFSTDLHLNSLQVNQLIARVASALERDLPADPLALSDASLGEAADVIHGLPTGASTNNAWNPGDWVHVFTDTWVPTTQHATTPATSTAQPYHLPPQPTPEDIVELRDFASTGQDVLLFHEGIGLGAARTLYLDRVDPGQRWTLIEVDRSGPAPDLSTLPSVAPGEFIDLRYDPESSGWLRRCSTRHTPSPRPLPDRTGETTLVTGGLAGITAECAAELASQDNSKLLFVGRTPADSPELRSALQVLRDQGLRASYRRLDLSDLAVTRSVLHDVAHSITAVIHGAAINVPQATPTVTTHHLQQARSAKVSGLQHLLDVVPSHQLAWLVTFGSIIERCGLEGQLAYAHANDELRQLVEDLDSDLPGSALHLQWSVWSGVGMGVDLGVLDNLARKGVSPIDPVTGRAQFLRALTTSGPVARLITGRYPDVKTRDTTPTTAIPLTRYLEAVDTLIPGTELITSAELSVTTDRSLAFHTIEGMSILPGVCSLEAAAQAATALDPTQSWTAFTDIDLTRPVTVDAEGRTDLQIAALDLGCQPGLTVRLRSQGQDVATVRVHPGPDGAASPWSPGTFTGLGTDLYDSLLFHRGPFERVQHVEAASASTVTAQLDTTSAQWFSAFLSQELTLGDPGVLDASIHVLQVCYPQRQLLPVAATSFTVYNPSPEGLCTVTAVERLGSSTDDVVFDVAVVDQTGGSVLEWEGLTLRRSHTLDGVKSRALVAPAVARAARAHLADPTLDLIITDGDVPAEDAIARIGGSVRREPCGRMSGPSPAGASTSRTRGSRLSGYSARTRIGVDWEIWTEAPDLGGPLARCAQSLTEAGAGRTVAAQLAWVTAEAVKKAGGHLGALTPELTGHEDDPGFGVVLTSPTHHVYAVHLGAAVGSPTTVAVAATR